MVIAHNISALNTYKSLGIAGGSMQKSMEKLSSGYKINKAGDDAAGLSISEKMRSQIRGLNQASTNAENGVSMIQTAEGALNETHSILQRMRELAVQAATDTNADEDRQALQSEVEQLTSEIQRIARTTEFNGMNILDGTKAVQYSKAEGTITVDAITKEGGYKAGDIIGNWELTADAAKNATSLSVKALDGFKIGEGAQTIDAVRFEGKDYTSITVTSGKGGVETANGSVYFHVGANSNQVINSEFKNMGVNGLGLGSIDANKEVSKVAIDVSTREGANAAIDTIDKAIKLVSQERSKYGAIQNRLEYTINNLNTTAENMTAAESTIRDVDMAEEMMEYTKNNILQQAAQAMLVQANARPQQALQLLQ